MTDLTMYVAVTPGGTVCDWLEASTEAQAWENLFIDASHMPYKNKQEFVDRGYVVEHYKNK
jgi:hypothetical protein